MVLYKLGKRLIFLTTILILVLGSIGTSPKVSAVASDAVTPTLRIQAWAPNLMDPQFAYGFPDIGHIKLIYEGLTRLDSNLQITPGAAESWVYSADHLQVTFNLRSNLKYSDGSILNAKRFEFSILRALDPLLNHIEQTKHLDIISGAKDYRSADRSKLTIDQLNALRAAVAVHALDTNNIPCTTYTQADCRKLQINLTAPNLSILSAMSLWMVFPAKEELITSGGADWWSEPSKQIGNGLFILTLYDTNEHGLFIPNPNYWRGAPTYNIDYRYTRDAYDVLDQYKKGQLDIISIQPEQLPEIQANPVLNSERHSYAGSCTYAILFHNSKEPFNDPKVRAAFAYAFNRHAWVEQALDGIGIPAFTWIPPGVTGHDAIETRWGYDPVKALQALSESTYGSAANLPLITLTFSDTPRNQTRYAWLANQWHDVFGIDPVLNPVDSTMFTWLTSNVATAPQTFIRGWCGEYPDPENYLSVNWHSSTTFAGRIGFADLQVDALLEQADAEQDPAARLTRYQQAQHMLIGDVPGTMAWHNQKIFLVKAYVTGAISTSFDSMWTGEVDPLTITLNKKYIFLPVTVR